MYCYYYNTSFKKFNCLQYSSETKVDYDNSLTWSKCKLLISKFNIVLSGKTQEFFVKKKKSMDISHQLLLLYTMLLNVLAKAISRKRNIVINIRKEANIVKF